MMKHMILTLTTSGLRITRRFLESRFEPYPTHLLYMWGSKLLVVSPFHLDQAANEQTTMLRRRFDLPDDSPHVIKDAKKDLIFTEKWLMGNGVASSPADIYIACYADSVPGIVSLHCVDPSPLIGESIRRFYVNEPATDGALTQLANQ